MISKICFHLTIVLVTLLLSPVCAKENDILLNSSIVVNVTLDGILNESLNLSCLPYPEILPSEYGDIHQVIWRWRTQLESYELPSTRSTQSASQGGWKAIKNFSLFAERLKVEHATVYECSVFNEQSILMYRYHITLIVKGPPSVPKSVTVEAISESSLKVNWVAGSDNNSSLKYHEVQLFSSINGQTTDRFLPKIPAPNLDTTIDNLRAFTEYSIRIRAVNAVGSSPWSATISRTTLPGIPKLSAYAQIVNVSDRVIEMDVRCSNPNNQTMKGEFKGYKVLVMNEDKPVDEKIYATNNSEGTKIILRSLEPCTNYDITIRVWNGRHPGPPNSHYARTLSGRPDKAPWINTRDISSDSFTVYWPKFNQHKCKIIQYLVKLCGYGIPNQCLSKKLNSSQLSHSFQGLHMHSKYTVRVAAGTGAGFGNFSEAEKVLTDVAPPRPPRIQEIKIDDNRGLFINWTLADISLPQSLISKNSLTTVENNNPNDYSNGGEGTPVYYKVCWKFEEEETCLPASENDTIKCQCDASRPYNTAMVPWQLLSSISDEVKIVKIGLQTMVYSIYCNSKQTAQCERLSEVSSRVTIKLSAKHLQIIRGSHTGISKSKLALVIFGVLCFTFLICLTLFLLLRERCWHRGYEVTEVSADSITYTRRSHSPVILPLGQSSHPPISCETLADHVARFHADDDAGYQAEFESIERSVRMDYSSSVARSQENMSKNRYSNVFAYDHSRVILHNPKKSDYINANYVDGYNRPQSFIATQGPMPSTFEDFWLMVWEQNSNVIVMISNFLERGRRKCDQYWPSDGSHIYGSITVQTVMQTELSYFTIRVFSIKNTRSTIKKNSRVRIVYHYQYTDWQDFDVPRSPLPVLAFVRSTVRHWHEGAGPIVVHCSAGVGRTGTYICIMSLMQQMEEERFVNIRGFLEHIRQQRMNLVQTEQQYAFIHDALREHLLFPQHECAKDNLAAYVRCLKEETSCGCTSLQKEFQLCIERQPFDYEYLEARRACNISKNRSSVWPIEQCRVNLPGEPGVEGSNYINASHLSGYWGRGEFIVTQHPLSSTEMDFWKMVWDQNCSVIVFLSNSDTQIFWPTDSQETKDIGWLTVSFRSREELPQMRSYEFLLSSSREDYALVCQLWELKAWPPTGSHPHSLDLVNLARNLSDLKKSNGPTVVVDNIGGNRAGIFCALNILVQQLTYEGVIDVYFVVKMFHLQRPHLFECDADLEFIYDAMAQFISNNDGTTKTSSANTQDHNGGSPPWIPLVNAWVPPENFLSSPNGTVERPHHQRHLSLPVNSPHLDRGADDPPLENGHLESTPSVPQLHFPPIAQILGWSAPNRSPSPNDDGKLLT